MCRGPFIFRRVSTPRLEAIPGEIEHRGLRLSGYIHSLMQLKFNLKLGGVIAGVRFHDERSVDNLILTGKIPAPAEADKSIKPTGTTTIAGTSIPTYNGYATPRAAAYARAAIADGRIASRVPIQHERPTSLSASPDGKTLYYTAGGFVWSMPATGGAATKLGSGDAVSATSHRHDQVPLSRKSHGCHHVCRSRAPHN